MKFGIRGILLLGLFSALTLRTAYCQVEYIEVVGQSEWELNAILNQEMDGYEGERVGNTMVVNVAGLKATYILDEEYVYSAALEFQLDSENVAEEKVDAFKTYLEKEGLTFGEKEVKKRSMKWKGAGNDMKATLSIISTGGPFLLKVNVRRTD